ncbi:hypothetical protein RND71_034981 [Anisodus tanguticus]|uniref:COI1 F-box domain-containing protein n=1 Tax=Anisodus tanguticus TaxID=243964 RepID=A0AAE1R3Z4_9SOLA|nr:hypothetical protein RND71_034981 [Anisodus tanguticus]
MGQSASTVAGAQNRIKFRSSPVIFSSMKESDDSEDVVVDVFDVRDFDYSSNLPDECLACIFHFLSSGDRKSCSLICRRWLRVEGQSRHHLSLNAQSDLVAVVPLIFSQFDSVM